MKSYVKTWRMEPIPDPMLAALAGRDVEKRFYDDRLERIPYDEPTDLVALSVETYTARRSYQIASEYRRRGVPVVMGGFHATLCPEEVARYAESVVIGEAETLFANVIDDYRHGTPQKIYQATQRPALSATPDRSIFCGKRYLPIHLVEFARGCRFKCDFCAIQTVFHATHSHRSIDRVIAEIKELRAANQPFFFIDDNITSGLEEAKELMRALIPEKIRWVTQTSIVAAHDDDTLDLMKRSGCLGVLIGFESINSDSLREMNKGFNEMRGGPAQALANMRRHGLAVYGTFIFGYDHDTAATIHQTVRFARDEGLFIAAFNHITPFPGTPLYLRMKSQQRLLYDAWWLDPRYRYNMIPFLPKQMSPEELALRCVEARRDFYSWRSIAQRSTQPAHRQDLRMLRNYFVINAMHHWDVETRSGLPLGDENCDGALVEAA